MHQKVQLGSSITPSYERRSVRRLAELDVETIVCYHGGVVGEEANGQLRTLVQDTAREGGFRVVRRARLRPLADVRTQ